MISNNGHLVQIHYFYRSFIQTTDSYTLWISLFLISLKHLFISFARNTNVFCELQLGQSYSPLLLLFPEALPHVRVAQEEARLLHTEPRDARQTVKHIIALSAETQDCLDSHLL